MKARIAVLFLVGVIVLMSLSFWTGYAQKPTTHTVWSYKSLANPSHQEIADAGIAGWEMVGFEYIPDNKVTLFYFKRPQ